MSLKIRLEGPPNGEDADRAWAAIIRALREEFGKRYINATARYAVEWTNRR